MRTGSGRIIKILVATLFSATLVGCGMSPVGILPDAPLLDDTTNLDAASPLPSDDCKALGEPSTETHREMFEALNNFRVANGLEPLVYSARLEAAANAHARDLYERGYFAHINPDGENPGKRAVQAGFCHEYVGENIAAGQKSVQAAQIAWENSPSHRENMLQPAYKMVGMGFYQDPTGRMYWAQELAYDLP